ncbi:hypothetical protein FQA39_LY15730 [Lamprigera yunnana]|nr:hypothetical protein FQA39_LY15730 [Lamprigera yunnana]
MFYKTLLILTIAIIGLSNGARILAVVPTPSYSHQVAFHSLWKELSLRGHQVTLVTTDLIKDTSLVNLTQIDISDQYEMGRKEVENVIKRNNMFEMLHLMTTFAEFHLSHTKIQKLIKNEDEHFDIVMVEFLTPFVLAYGARFKCPIILVSSIASYPWIDTIMGNPRHPIIYPEATFNFNDELTLFDRVNVVLSHIGMDLFYKFYTVPTQQEMIYKYFGEDYPLIDDMARNISIVLANSDTVFHKIKPTLPSIISFGGNLYRPTPPPLSKEVKNALDAAKHGFIYFSLGSNAKSKNLAKETRQIILETFADLPYTVLWKFEEDALENKPKNVIISKWLPQLSVLRHPNIKLFITQGGVQSMEEGIYSHIPMIGMPVYTDQHVNAKKIVSKGFGLSIDLNALNKEKFKESILEVISNPRYKKRVTELAELAQDQPTDSLEKAVWWTDVKIFKKITMFYKTLLILIISIIGLSNGARILAVVPTPSYSHQVAFHSLWKELSLRGHQVTLVTTDLIKDASLVNLTQIDISDSYEKGREEAQNMIKRNSMFDMLHLMTTFAAAGQ